MSKYLSFPDVAFKSKSMLLAALADIGFDASKIEDRRGNLVGYTGDTRPEIADIIIRRHNLSRSSNDVGFVLDDGAYRPIISEYDQGYLQGGKLLANLRVAYGTRVVAEVQRRLRGTVQRTVEGSLVKLKVSY